MTRAIAALVLVLALAPAAAAPAAQGPPLGAFVVGADPSLLWLAEGGAAAWNATGAVAFAVEPSGCGTGDVTVCAVRWNAGWPGGSFRRSAVPPTINVDAIDVEAGTVGPALLCHELGHFLGLYLDGVHPPNGTGTCMSDTPGAAGPNAADLARLGVAPPPGAGPGAPVVALPDTGTGAGAAASARRRRDRLPYPPEGQEHDDHRQDHQQAPFPVRHGYRSSLPGTGLSG